LGYAQTPIPCASSNFFVGVHTVSAQQQPMTVYLYERHGVYVVPDHKPYDPSLHNASGEAPIKAVRVWAASGAGAIRAALMASVKKEATNEYKLTLGEQADLNLNRLAAEQNCTVGDILRNAINTYATVKRRASDGYVWVHERRNGKLVIVKIAIP
jgi:hypothetical protein